MSYLQAQQHTKTKLPTQSCFFTTSWSSERLPAPEAETHWWQWAFSRTLQWWNIHLLIRYCKWQSSLHSQGHRLDWCGGRNLLFAICHDEPKYQIFPSSSFSYLDLVNTQKKYATISETKRLWNKHLTDFNMQQIHWKVTILVKHWPMRSQMKLESCLLRKSSRSTKLGKVLSLFLEPCPSMATGSPSVV